MTKEANNLPETKIHDEVTIANFLKYYNPNDRTTRKFLKDLLWIKSGEDLCRIFLEKEKQTAIAFAEWMVANGLTFSQRFMSGVGWWDEHEKKFSSSQELYSKFIEGQIK